MNKYRARKVKMDGYTFDSKAEATRYAELKLMEKAGEISHLEIHPRFVLFPVAKIGKKALPKIQYTADFAYIQNGKRVVEDVKGMITRDAALRMNIFQRLHPEIDFRVVYGSRL